MYASVRRYKVDPKNVDQIVKRVPEAATLIRKGKGFRAYYFVKGADGAIVTVSVFDDRAGAEESNKTAATFVKQNIASLIPKPPEIVAGEVVVHK